MRTTILALCALAAGLAGATAASAQDDESGGDPTGARFERKLAPGSGYTCTATNALRSAQCSTTCASRETADCEDAEGSGAPTCNCTEG